MALDVNRNQAYVYEAVPTDQSIITVNLGSGSVTNTVAMIAQVNAIDCDPATNTIYVLTSSNSAGLTAADALVSIHPDGTGGITTIKSFGTPGPYTMALDVGNNRAFVHNSILATRALLAVDLTSGTVTTVLDQSGLSASTAVTALAVPGIPVVTSTSASSVSFSSATVGGNVTRSDVSVTDRGVVYSTSNTTPTIANSKFSIGAGTGSFSNTLTGLSASATYYMRSYATSAAGTAYGAVSNFTTFAAPIAINSIHRVTSSPGNASSVQFTVTFAASVSGLTTGNFSTTTTGVSGSGISTLSGSGTTYTVTVNTGTGDETIGLNLNNATGLTPGISTALPYAGQVYSIDKTAPSVSISAPSVSIINTGGSVTYTVTYADANFNSSTLAPGNITLNSTGGASGTIGVSGTGTTRTVTISSITGSGSLGISLASGTATDLAGNSAAAAGPSGTFAVTLISQHISFAALPSKTYGNGQFSANASSDNNGIPVVLSSDNTAVATISGGNINIVGAGTANITASQAGDATHSAASSVVQQLTVSKAALTITANNQSSTYGAALPALTASYSGFATGESSANLTTQPTLSTTATAASHVAGSPYTITVSCAAATNYAITYAAGSLTIATAPLTVTADNKSMTYGGTVPTLTASYTGFVNGDNFASLTTPPTLTTAGTSVSHANTYSISASGVVDPDYSISYVPGALTIGQAPLTITADNQSMTYGGVVPTLTASYTGFVNGDNNASLTTAPSMSTTATASSHVAGSPYAITAAAAVAPDYSIAYVPGSLTINAAPLTISADNQSMTYGGTVPTLTASYTGFVNGDNSASLFTPPTITTTGTSASHVNTYPITAGGAADPDYSIAYTAGILTIGTAPLTISADNQSMTYGGAVPTLTASYAGFVNGDISSTLTTPPTLSTTATAASHAAGSPYPIAVTGAVDADYSISYVSGNLTVGAAPLTITADNQNMTYGGTFPTLTASYNGFVNGDNSARLAQVPNITTTGTPSSPVGTYPVILSGAIDADYAISYAIGLLTIGKAPLTITADNQSVISGETFPTLTASYNGFVNNDAPDSLTTLPLVSTTATPSSNVGTYPITASGADDANYDISYVPGTFNILPSADATLSGLTISSGVLSPAFASNTISYHDTVSNSVASVTVTPVTGNAHARVKVNGVLVTSGTASASIPVNVGPNTITSIVTAEDGVTTKTYTIAVFRISNNNLLSNLTISQGVLSPAFASNTIGYHDTVSNSVASVTLTPVTGNAHATVKVNGVLVTSGTASASIPVTVGPNTITAMVTAEDGVTTKTYTIAVFRISNNSLLSNLTISQGVLSPVFASNTISYHDTVSNSVSSVTVTPVTGNAHARVIVNGTPVTSGSASAAIPLSIGNNTITAIVTAEDGVTTKTYIVTVYRTSSNNLLSNLTISQGVLSPAFAGNTISYHDTVSNNIASVAVTPVTGDAHATVKVNGVLVTSGTASASIPVNVGPNTITSIVTAEDGVTTKTYTVAVFRISNNNLLSNLTISQGALSPAFASNTISYHDTVSNSIASLTVTPVTGNAHARVKVNGTLVTSGSASAAIPLSIGNNTITAFVTAEDGVTTKTYTVTVHRLTAGGLNSLYLTGNNEQTPLVSSLNEKVEANNILSPNGDGINDIWIVKNIAFYPNNIVTVFNSDGKIVFNKKGYTNDWDGTTRGGALNEGTYYYKIDLGNGKMVRGFITVVSH